MTTAIVSSAIFCGGFKACAQENTLSPRISDHLSKRMNFNDLKIIVNSYGLWHDTCLLLEQVLF